MAAVCRVGDHVTGECRGPGHDPRTFLGTWTQSMINLGETDGKAIICVGDLGVTDCGHHFVASSGSDIFYLAETKVHRVGDQVTVIEDGEGISISGSSIFFSE